MKMPTKKEIALEALEKIKISDEDRRRYMVDLLGDWKTELRATTPEPDLYLKEDTDAILSHDMTTVHDTATVAARRIRDSSLVADEVVSKLHTLTAKELVKKYEPEIKKSAIKEFALEFCKLLVEEWETSNFNGNVIKQIDALGDPFHAYDCFHTVSALRRVGAIDLKELAASLGMTEDDLKKRVAYYENEEV